MKIDLSDNVIMMTALGKVKEGEYFDALCLFARVDSYESRLNQIGCLCKLHDVGYAIDLYRKTLARFCYTHNVYKDLRSIGDATELIVPYFDNVPKGEFAKRVDYKYTADERLLGYYPFELDEEFFDDDVDLLHEILTDDFDDTRSVFYDVKSTDFFRNLRQRMEQAYVRGNFVKGRELQRQFLDIDTDDVETLEVQLFLCLTQQQWEKGVPYALRVANLDISSYRAIGTAVQILSRVDGYDEICQQLLLRLYDCRDDIPNSDMTDYVGVASKLGYGELTLKFADELYSRLDACCSALRLCAKVYFNGRQYQKAREATLTLLRAVPWDSGAVTLLTYINNGMTLQLDNSNIYNSLAQHYDVPTQLSVVAQYSLLKQLEQNEYELSKQYYPYLDCLCKLCVSAVIKGNTKNYRDELTALSAIVNSVRLQDEQSFVDFAKEQLCKVLPEPSVNREFLRKMIALGYRDKVLMSVSHGYYSLNLSGLSNKLDGIFVDALSLCATLYKVDVKRLEKSYKMLKSNFGDDLSGDADSVRQIAYCLLAMSYKRFEESNESVYFDEDDRALYEKYIRII